MELINLNYIANQFFNFSISSIKKINSDAKKSSVMCLFLENNNKVYILLTKRSNNLSNHAGEICFPGGKPDPQDKDLVDTALREAKEELGIQKALILGKLSSIPLYTSDFRLEPVVGFIDNSPLHPNPDEVSAILFVDLLRTIDLPKIDGIPTQLNGKKHLSPIFDPKDLIAEPPTTTPIYGGTAYVLLELLTILGEVLQIALPPIVESNRTFPFKTKTPVSN